MHPQGVPLRLVAVLGDLLVTVPLLIAFAVLLGERIESPNGSVFYNLNGWLRGPSDAATRLRAMPPPRYERMPPGDYERCRHPVPGDAATDGGGIVMGWRLRS